MKFISIACAALALCTALSCNHASDVKSKGSENPQFSNVKNATADGDKMIPPTDPQHPSDNGVEYFKTDTVGAPPQPPTPVKKVAGNNPDWDKKIVKTATLSFEVKDFRQFTGELRTRVHNAGGYIAGEEQNQSDYKIENSVTIKIPVDQFDDAVTLITSGIGKIEEKKISTEDVTGEYVDTRSRMEARKQVRQRYLDLLGQARNMDDILNIQSHIDEIQESIESANGRINYLGHAAAYSTINLTYFQILNAAAQDDKPSFGTQVARAFKTGWNMINDLFIGLISVWPLLIVMGLLVIAVRRWATTKQKPVA